MKKNLSKFKFSRCIIPILIFVFATSGACWSQNYDSKQVSIITPVGYKIAGTYYSFPGEKGSAVLLLPDLLGKRTDWNNFLPILKDAGVKSILSIDLPGSGSSNVKNNEEISWRSFSEKDFNNISNELDAAWDHLKKASSTDAAHMSIMGSVLGANCAAVLSSNHPDVKALVLLSPGLVYRAVASFWAMFKYPDRPTLLVATKTDFYSVASCQKIKEDKGRHVQFQMYSKPAYGTDILANNPPFKAMLTDWLKSNL
jgi:dienelactone hydrolase